MYWKIRLGQCLSLPFSSNMVNVISIMLLAADSASMIHGPSTMFSRLGDE